MRGRREKQVVAVADRDFGRGMKNKAKKVNFR